MLIWIETEGQDPRELNWQDWLEALDNLGEAGFRGDHLVLGDRLALESISRLPDLSRKAKAYFASAATRMSTVGSIREKVKPVVVDPVLLVSVERGGVTRIPLAHFADETSVNRALLLCEHMYDCEVIAELAESRLRSLGISGACKLSMKFASGGGGGTHLALRTTQRREPLSIGVCVVDSDREHPNGALGTTASACRASFIPVWNWKLYVINAREMENLLPPELVRAAGFQELRKAEYYCEECWAIGGYVDLKREDNLCRFRELDPANLSYVLVQAAYTSLVLKHPAIDRCEGGVCAGFDSCSLNTLYGNLLRHVAAWIRPGISRRIGKLTTVPALDEACDRVIEASLARAFSVA